MTLRIVIISLLWVLSHVSKCDPREIPSVPKQVDFANMKLVLTDGVVKEIQNDVNALRSSEKHFNLQLDRVNLYFPIVEKILKEENVPDDFKYLVIQESGLISDAVSVAKAVGFWQFKDFTAREVGLRVDNRIDERKNIVASTRAAAEYLKRNNFQFDNWAYALSAYQAGLGGVRKYVDRKYYGARKMPVNKNSHWYLKKYIAHKIAFEGVIGGKHSEGLKLVTEGKGEGKDLGKIAREYKVEEELVKYYNKWIRGGKIPSDKQYFVVVPVNGKVEKYVAEENRPIEKSIEVPEEKIYPKELKPGITNKRGIRIKINGVPAVMATELDDLNTLSAVAGISDKQFLKYNDLGEQSPISSGEVYFVNKKKSKSAIGFHVATDGETLWEISQRFGVRLNSLARKNRISMIDEIKEGQVIWLNSRRPKDIPIEYFHGNSDGNEIKPPKPLPKKTIVDNAPAEDPATEDDADIDYQEAETSIYLKKTGKTHKVVAGETLWSISRRFDVTIEELKKWNDLTKYDNLRIGQELFVKAPKLQERKPQQTKVYRVKPGDTLYRIAEAHNMEVVELMEINGKKNSYLSVGEELKVYKKN